MRKLLFAILFGLLTLSASAQKNVILRINHMMNGAALAANTEITNDLGHKFNFNRVQYFLSDIRIVHDGGIVTTAKDTYLFVDALKPKDFALGAYNVTNVEEIYFSVGVDEAKNHLDHTKYPAHHALGPKSPTMHWGWTSGYRFAALSGKCGENMDLTWEIHSLFDEYYYSVYLPTSATDQRGDLLIAINADYGKAVSTIELTSRFAAHGSRKQDVVLLENFRDSVFSNLNGVLDVLEVEKEDLFAYPNPSTGNFQFSPEVVNKVEKVKVMNNLGAVVLELTAEDLTLEQVISSGFYTLFYSMKDGTFTTQKLIVQGN